MAGKNVTKNKEIFLELDDVGLALQFCSLNLFMVALNLILLSTQLITIIKLFCGP